MRFSKSTKAPAWPGFLLFFVVVVVAVVCVIIIIATIAVVVYDNFFLSEKGVKESIKGQNCFNLD